MEPLLAVPKTISPDFSTSRQVTCLASVSAMSATSSPSGETP
jgi:hypothetical protein